MTNAFEIHHLTDSGQVQLYIRHDGQVQFAEPVAFPIPMNQSAYHDMQWYFSEYLEAPFEPVQQRAEGVESGLRNLGRLLFEVVFQSNDQAKTYYSEAVSQGIEEWRLIIMSSDAEFLNLPWELLNEPEGGYLVPRLASIVRRGTSEDLPIFEAQQPVDQFNVLVVSPMPSMSVGQPVGSLARETVDILESLEIQAELDYLRPPTFAALTEQLISRPGHYHLVHFDAFAVHESPDNLTFESAESGPDPIPIEQVGKALAVAGVPAALITPDRVAPNSATSAAQVILLAESGVPVVCSVPYPFHSSETGNTFLQQFYRAFTRGSDVAASLAQARKALMDDPERSTIAGKRISWDWITPVIYETSEYRPSAIDVPRPDPLAPPVIQPEEDTPSDSQLPAAGKYALVGRHSETRHIERLFNKHQVIILAGNTGTGKTELSLGIARWLHKTGRGVLPGGVFYSTFEASHPGGLEQIVHEIGTTIAGLKFADMNANNQRRWVVEYLQENRSLLIWDNLENVAGFPEGSPGILDEVEQAQLNTFLTEITVEGKSLALLAGRRSDELWLSTPHTVHQLSGLTGHDRSELAAKIVQTVGVDAGRLGPETEELLNLLDGHPLAMQIALPLLKDVPAPAVTAEIHKEIGQPSIPVEEGRDAYLAATMEYSFSRMSHRSRTHLPFLAMFQRRVMMDILNHITQESAYSGAMGEELGWGACRTLLRSAQASGFIDTISPSVYQIHPALPHFLGQKLQRLVRGPGIRQLEMEFVRVYADTADYFMESLYENQDSGVTAVLAEEGNLNQALGLAVEAGQWDNTQLLVQPLAQVFRMQKRYPELRRLRGQLLESVGNTASSAAEKGAIDLWRYLLGTDANESVDFGELERAETLNQQLLEYLEAQEGADEDPRAAAVYHQFGLIALHRFQLDDAAEWFNKSLAIIEDGEDQATAADDHYGLGQVKQHQRYYTEAKELYQKALDIHQRIPDEEEMIKDYRSLGLVCQLKFEFDEAENWYQRARGIVEENRDEDTAILVFHELGTLSHAQYLFDDAKSWYEQALQLSDRLGKREQMATEMHHLGLLSQARGIVYEEAEEWFLAALEIREELGDIRGVGDECRQLAVLFHEQKKYPEAAEWYNKAREIFEELNDVQRTCRTYGQLGMIAEEQGDLTGSLEWVARTYQMVVDYDLPIMVQVKSHLARLRDTFGEDEFSKWWQGFTGNDAPTDLEVDTSAII